MEFWETWEHTRILQFLKRRCLKCRMCFGFFHPRARNAISSQCRVAPVQYVRFGAGSSSWPMLLPFIRSPTHTGVWHFKGFGMSDISRFPSLWSHTFTCGYRSLLLWQDLIPRQPAVVWPWMPPLLGMALSFSPCSLSLCHWSQYSWCHGSCRAQQHCCTILHYTALCCTIYKYPV